MVVVLPWSDEVVLDDVSFEGVDDSELPEPDELEESLPESELLASLDPDASDPPDAGADDSLGTVADLLPLPARLSVL